MSKTRYIPASFPKASGCHIVAAGTRGDGTTYEGTPLPALCGRRPAQRWVLWDGWPGAEEDLCAACRRLARPWRETVGRRD